MQQNSKSITIQNRPTLTHNVQINRASAKKLAFVNYLPKTTNDM